MPGLDGTGAPVVQDPAAAHRQQELAANKEVHALPIEKTDVAEGGICFWLGCWRARDTGKGGRAGADDCRQSVSWDGPVCLEKRRGGGTELL